MAGDKIHTTVQFYYSSVDADNSAASGIESLISNIATLVATSVVPGGAIKDGAMNMASTLSAQPTLASMLNTNPNTSGTNKAPKAYLNILLFNEQFQFDAVNSKVLPVWYNRNTWATLSRVGATAVQAMKNGYAYVYFSNESKENVYFDNFTLTHERGPILEETHYYPFGLTMAGISSRAMGKTRNRLKFNGGTELENKEFSDGAGLELYATEFRSYDPQIGRFHQIDPIADISEAWSPYAYANNNPIYFNDPLVLSADSVIKPNLSPPVCADCPSGKMAEAKNLPEVVVTAKKNSASSSWGVALDIFQTGLDLVGMIPVAGEIADGANALIYTARGDYTNAALSTAAVIPIVGNVATGEKLAKKAIKPFRFTKNLKK